MLVLRLWDTGTQVGQQLHKAVFFGGLSPIVVVPVLRIGRTFGYLRRGCSGAIIRGNHGGADTYVMVRGRRCFQHRRLRFVPAIVVDNREEVKLKCGGSPPIQLGLRRYAYRADTVSTHNVAYDCSVADSVTERGRGVPRAGFEPARCNNTGDFADRCVCQFHHLGTVYERRGGFPGLPRRFFFANKKDDRSNLLHFARDRVGRSCRSPSLCRFRFTSGQPSHKW